MALNRFHTGELVTHPRKPEWGPGKVIKVEHDGVWVFWRDMSENNPKKINLGHVQLQSSPMQADPILDNISPAIDKDGKVVVVPARVTATEAIRRFIQRFPHGFQDPGYIGDAETGERQYKWDAHLAAVDRLGNGRYGDLLTSDRAALIDAVQRCYRSLNLLSLYEKSALTDALREETSCREFLEALGVVIYDRAPVRDHMVRYFASVQHLPASRGRVATWPVATIIPFLLNPEEHMFLKPEVTKTAAESLGFNLNYRAEPNWTTYERLLAMGRVYKEQLAEYQPRDMIDVQSFFWVTCGGYHSLND